MKIVNYANYFLRLRELLGFTATVRFALSYVQHKLSPPRNGRLASIPIGPYLFYFPSIDYFSGLCMEIFFKQSYCLAQTQTPIRVLDCGANIGVSLLYIKVRAPNAQVTCFEPNPAAREVLMKNIEVNGWNTDVHVLPYALGREVGSVEFFVDGTEATSSSGSTLMHEKYAEKRLDTYHVEMRTLSSFVVESIDLLKIDIEGGELDVLNELRTAQKLHMIREIQLEFHYSPKSPTLTLHTILTLLETSGFHTLAQSNGSVEHIIGKHIFHTYMVFAWRTDVL
jgi:FkbM family methyltransferase